MPRFSTSRRGNKQRGVILLMLLIALALLIIALGVAAPKMAQAIKRDREEEMIHRGAQYARAVKKYYKKFGRYPGTIEQLENTNNIHFLRKRYADPMAKDGKWRPVKFGEARLGQQGGGAGSIGGGGGGCFPRSLAELLTRGETAPRSNPELVRIPPPVSDQVLRSAPVRVLDSSRDSNPAKLLLNRRVHPSGSRDKRWVAARFSASPA